VPRTSAKVLSLQALLVQKVRILTQKRGRKEGGRCPEGGGGANTLESETPAAFPGIEHCKWPDVTPPLHRQLPPARGGGAGGEGHALGVRLGPDVTPSLHRQLPPALVAGERERAACVLALQDSVQAGFGGGGGGVVTLQGLESDGGGVTLKLQGLEGEQARVREEAVRGRGAGGHTESEQAREREREREREEAVSTLLETLDRSVRRRVAVASRAAAALAEEGDGGGGAASVAVMFSGGVDSTLLAALAHR
jgi:hypothetical protein